MNSEIQTDEVIQGMQPLNPEPVETNDEGGATVTFDENDEIVVEVQQSDDPEPASKEALEDDDPSIEDIEQELTEEQMTRLNLTKGVRDRLGKLTWQKNEERRQREAAEAQAQEAVRFAQQQQARIEEYERVMARGEQVMLSEVKHRTAADLAKAEQDFTAAAESGDPSRMLEAQKALNKAQVEAMQADQYVSQQVPRQQPTQGQVPQQPTAGYQPQQPAQDPKLVEWMGKNTWFKQDPIMTQEAMSIHRELTEIRGVDPRTDEYYSQLDSRLAQKFPTLQQQGTEMTSSSTTEIEGQGGPAATPPTTVVAPPSGSTGPGDKKTQGGPRTVQLTPAQVRFAETLGLSKEQYAKQLLKEQSNG